MIFFPSKFDSYSFFFRTFQGSEVSAVVQQWKELGCAANTVNVMDENREKPGAQTKAFWKILGDKKEIQSKSFSILFADSFFRASLPLDLPLIYFTGKLLD